MSTPQDPFASPPPGAQPPPLPPGPPPGYGPPPPGYGPPPPGYGQWGPAPYGQRTTNGLAIAALVCGLLGCPFGVTAVLGIVLGVVALNQIKERGQQGKGLAIAGIVLGSLWVLLFLSLFVLGFSNGAEFHTTCTVNGGPC